MGMCLWAGLLRTPVSAEGGSRAFNSEGTLRKRRDGAAAARQAAGAGHTCVAHFNISVRVGACVGVKGLRAVVLLRCAGCGGCVLVAPEQAAPGLAICRSACASACTQGSTELPPD